jgi:hypothetical protein
MPGLNRPLSYIGLLIAVVPLDGASANGQTAAPWELKANIPLGSPSGGRSRGSAPALRRAMDRLSALERFPTE